ncbi:MAG: galactose mutarotase [Alistipes sp.]|nr:galactose mutarotase [Alistipes sp.]MBQ3247859.1 galactose mutarotase [Alistipes sp.]
MKKLIFVATLLALTACNCNSNQPQLLDKEAFTTTVDGKDVSLYTLKAGDLTMQVTNYGARVVSLWVPGRDGSLADVEIGYENIDRYINNTGERYLGAVVGPFANRIAKGRFVLDGKEYHTPINNNGQTLHGGILGVDRIVWDVKEVTENKIVFYCLLPDGQDGFPGNREIEMVYELTPENEFAVSYKATTDAPTVVNLSHHSFFNLEGDGEGTILDHVLQINGDAITPYGEGAIPTGEIMPVEGTPFDFREPHAIGERVNEDHPQLKAGLGYDHNWILNRAEDGMEVKVADVYSPKSGRGMEVWTDQIALQFYGGNFFDGSFKTKYGKPVLFRGAIALETQRYPDSPNHPEFPSCTLRPGEVYTHSCIYKFYAK